MTRTSTFFAELSFYRFVPYSIRRSSSTRQVNSRHSALSMPSGEADCSSQALLSPVLMLDRHQASFQESADIIITPLLCRAKKPTKAADSRIAQ
ncbi:MAG TPA: hypothetical protein VH592_15805 [Gemmataceae bacterium]|jgi:hypothetical protein